MAFRIPSALDLLLLVKKLMVMGIMEKMQGVKIASSPLPNEIRNRISNGFLAKSLLLSGLVLIVVFASVAGAATVTFVLLVSVVALSFVVFLSALFESDVATDPAVAVFTSAALPPASLMFTLIVASLGGRHILSSQIW